MGLLAAIRREYNYISHAGRTLWMLRLVKPNSPRTIVDIVESQVARTPGSPAIYCLDQMLTYGEMDARANRYANWARAQGIGRGACVALLMENRADEHLRHWLGMFKVGAQVALINTNLTGQSLAHSIAISGAAHAIVGAELAGNFAAAEFDKTSLDKPPQFWVEGLLDPPIAGAQDLSAALHAASAGCRRAEKRAKASPARTGPFSFIPPAPPACPRRPTSAICACFL